jgi:hypothetical protein
MRTNEQNLAGELEGDVEIMEIGPSGHQFVLERSLTLAWSSSRRKQYAAKTIKIQ